MSLLQRHDSLTLDQQQRIDAICSAFEDRWLSGTRPVLEHFLCQVEPALFPDLLQELLRIDLDYRRGLAEVPVVEHYHARFPGLELVVQRAFQWLAKRDIALRFPPGQLIGRYRVIRTLGSGSFGTVYLACDERLQREVAVKVPHRSQVRSPEARERLVCEARTVARLHHPHIVAVYDAGHLEDGTVFVVMQYVPGRSLADRLRDGRPTPSQAVAIARQVAQAVECAHCQGIVHRDLKPSNILLDAEDRALVTDFGLALFEHGGAAPAGEYAGTPTYMAPEQLQGDVAGTDGRADLWAVGVVLYQMLTGHRPFRGATRRELAAEVGQRDPKPLRQWVPHLPRRLEQVCGRCLARHPQDRYASARDLNNALHRWEREQRRRRRAWRPVLAGLLLVLSAACAALPFLLRPPADRSADRPLLSGRLDLIVWPAAAHGSTEFRLGANRALQTLCPHDRVRVEVEVQPPAYLYLVWLDTEGSVLPVYPWQQGDWTRLRQSAPPRSRLALPEPVDEAWAMGSGPSGMETVLLLARATPLPHAVDLPALLADLPARQLPLTRQVAEFRSTQPPPATEPAGRKKRGPDLQQTTQVPAPLRTLHQRLLAVLQPHFDLVQGISFPVNGSDASLSYTTDTTTPARPAASGITQP